MGWRFGSASPKQRAIEDILSCKGPHSLDQTKLLRSLFDAAVAAAEMRRAADEIFAKLRGAAETF